MKSPYNYQQAIYDLVSVIPRGRITSYGALANFLSLGSARMVGYALNKLSGNNPDKIPAHRVVNAKGVLTGWRAFGTPTMMALLLKSEGVEIENNRVKNFEKYFWHPEELRFIEEKNTGFKRY